MIDAIFAVCLCLLETLQFLLCLLDVLLGELATIVFAKQFRSGRETFLPF